MYFKTLIQYIQTNYFFKNRKTLLCFVFETYFKKIHIASQHVKKR